MKVRMFLLLSLLLVGTQAFAGANSLKLFNDLTASGVQSDGYAGGSGFLLGSIYCMSKPVAGSAARTYECDYSYDSETLVQTFSGPHAEAVYHDLEFRVKPSPGVGVAAHTLFVSPNQISCRQEEESSRSLSERTDCTTLITTSYN